MRRCATIVFACLIVSAFYGEVRSQNANSDRGSASFHKAAGPAPRPGTIFLYPERVSHNDEFINVERGVVFVPMSRATSDSNVIGIEVYRFKAERRPSKL